MLKANIPTICIEVGLTAIEDLEENVSAEALQGAFLAMLNSWPGMEMIYRSEDEKLFTIILPLPATENSDG